MRTRVALVVGLLVFGCAGIAWAAAPADPPTQLIRIALPSVVAGAVAGACGGWVAARRSLRPLQTRADAAVAALGDAEAQLVRKEKLAVLGQLAGSVGHELRNPLGVMSNAVYYLEMVQPAAPDDVREYHGILRAQVALAERIIGDLLDFSRVRPPQRETVTVSRLFDEQLARLPLPSGVRLDRQGGEDDLTVSVDPVQIGQVLYNLLLNAVQAMDGGGGVLTVGARRGDGLVHLEVADTGPGIPAGFERKIFEALFTTKARGVGLGLAVSRGLAEANGGRLDVVSRPGAGATFTLTLPLPEREAAA